MHHVVRPDADLAHVSSSHGDLGAVGRRTPGASTPMIGRPVDARRSADGSSSPGLSSDRSDGRAGLGHPVAADGTRQPNAASTSASMCRRRRSPTRRSPAGPTRGPGVPTSGWSSSICTMVGTANSRVTRWVSMRRSTSPAIEAGEQHVLPAEAGEVVRRAPAVDVEQRDGVQDDVVAGDRPCEGVVDGVQVQRTVGEDRALRRDPVEPLRVEDLGRGVRSSTGGGARGAALAMASDAGLVVVAEHHGSAPGCAGPRAGRGGGTRPRRRRRRGS